jgi:hypothetical protein
MAEGWELYEILSESIRFFSAMKEYFNQTDKNSKGEKHE